MYSTQQLYFQENFIYNGLVKIGKFVLELLCCFDRAMRACRVANQQPLDRDAVWEIINED